MKDLPRLLRIALGTLALVIVPLAARAEDAPEKLSPVKAKYDADKDGKLSAEEKTQMKADATAKTKAASEEALKQALAKYDANHNGRLDDAEKEKMKADEAAAGADRAAKYKQMLAKYDANHDGKLDDAELAKMKEDEKLTAKTDRQGTKNDMRTEKMVERALGNKGTKSRKP